MTALSPVALGGCLIAVQVAALIGLWLLRVGERTPWAHSLRGFFTLTLLLLGILTAAAFFVMPRVSMASGFLLAVLAVLAIVDLKPNHMR